MVKADLRNHKLHTRLDLPNAKELSNVIAENIDLQDIIQPVDCVSLQSQNHIFYHVAKEIGKLPLGDIFYVLTAGQIPPNPTNLLSSHMQNLAEEFRLKYI